MQGLQLNFSAARKKLTADERLRAGEKAQLEAFRRWLPSQIFWQIACALRWRALIMNAAIERDALERPNLQ
jgi:hypothetical protein